MKKSRPYHLIAFLAVSVAVIYLLSCGTKDPLSPDANYPGGKIVFVREDAEPGYSYGIYKMNSDGSNIEPVIDSLALSEIQPHCSSDGNEVAFAWNRDGNREIYTVSIDGTDLTRITTTSPMAEYFPQWSPGDSLLAVYGRESIVDSLDIWIIRLDGTIWRYFTDDQAQVGDFIHSWSPDGTRMVFVSNRDGDNEIYDQLIEPGAIPNKLTDNDFDDTYPRYSHDGEWIAFIRVDTADGEDDTELYKMRSDGSDVQRLTDNSVNEDSPSWSPDDTWIAFTSVQEGHYDIFAIRADGVGMKNLTNNEIRDAWADWIR